MAQDIYLKIDGIKGDSTSEHGKGMTELLSFSHGISMPLTHGHASGTSVKHGRVDMHDLTITKYLDPISPTLNLKCAGGENIKHAEIFLWGAEKSDGEPHNYYTIKIEDVIITSVSIGGGGGGLPMETVTFHFNTIHWTHQEQKHDAPGGGAGKVASGWDLQLNKKK